MSPTHSIHRARRRLRRLLTVGAAVAVAATFAVPGAGGGASALDLPPLGVSLWHDLSLPAAVSSARLLTEDWAGDVWYVNGNSPVSLVRIDQNTHAQTVYPIDTHSWVVGMVGAPDGTVWYTNIADFTINRLDPVTGAITSISVSRAIASSTALAVGADGAIWLGNTFSAELARVSPSGSLSIIPEPHGERVFDMEAAADGRLWYVRSGPDALGAFDPVSGAFSDFGVAVDAFSLTTGKSGSLWLGGDGEVTEVALDGSAETYPLPATSSGIPTRVYGLVGGDLAGDDEGEVYFTSTDLGFTRVEADGTLHSSRLDTPSLSMVIDGQGHLWAQNSTLTGDSLLWY